VSDGGSLPPTPRRLRRARAEGDVPHSPVTLGFGAAVGALLAAPLSIRLVEAGFRADLQRALATTGSSELPDPSKLLVGIVPILPVLAAAALGALALAAVQVRPLPAHLGQGGRRKSPRDELPRRLVRVLVGFGLAGALPLWVATLGLDAATRIQGSWFEHAASLARSVAWSGVLALALVALADTWLARRAWRLRLRMTPAERRAEERSARGAPELRQERSRRARAAVEARTLLRR
jgi:flagellar biosynthesis protein FlhB